MTQWVPIFLFKGIKEKGERERERRRCRIIGGKEEERKIIMRERER